MKTKPDHWYRQAAAAPVRMVNGRTEVLLVSSLRSGRWILPKGIVDPGTTPQQSAANEAWEEAGVKGAVAGRRLGVFKNKKWGDVCTVEVFRLEVKKISEQWPESDKRKRQWFKLDDAIKEVHPDGAALVLQKIAFSLLNLTLVRHAKSSREDMSLDDFERPLNPRGLRDAPEIGRRLRERCILPDSIISSPACRTKETARIIADKIGYPKDKIIDIPVIYDAEADDLLQLLKCLPDEKRDVMLVGHNPGLTDLAFFLLQSGIENIPTCGVMRLAFDAQHWQDISPHCASLLMYDYPKKDTSGS